MNATPTARPNGVRVDRTYRPDLERQVRALLAVLTKKAAPAGQAEPPGGGEHDGAAPESAYGTATGDLAAEEVHQRNSSCPAAMAGPNEGSSPGLSPRELQSRFPERQPKETT